MLAPKAGDSSREGAALPVAALLASLGLLVGLGAALLLTDRWFSYADDEIVVLQFATDLSRILTVFSATSIHEHPPLYDLLIHFWLQWTGGSTPWVRVPAIVFYVAGIWLCGAAARRLAGSQAFLATIALGALWPFGFHHGRLAGWFSFSFLMTAWVTLAYLRLLKTPSLGRWFHLQAAAIALVYTNYFGWALLASLGGDLAIRRDLSRRRRLAIAAGTLITAVAAFVPLLPAFLQRLRHGLGPRSSLVSTAANAAFTYFSLFTSEAVAPWYWSLSLVAAGLVLLLTRGLLSQSGGARRLFLYFSVLLAAMAVLGILVTKRVLLITPWFVIPLGILAAAPTHHRWRRWPAIAVAAVFAIGWIGIADRSHYSSQRFVEPWRDIAKDSAKALRDGALVIADNYSFLWELTQELRVPLSNERWRFAGLVGYEVKLPGLVRPKNWLESGRPLRPRILVVKGQAEPDETAAIEECRRTLRERCQLESTERLVPDTGYNLKAKLFPSFHQIPWRVELDRYSCK